jgi:hypothetical protein
MGGPGRTRRSTSERRQNDQPAADDQSERDTADDRENAMPVRGRLGPSGILRRYDAHPEVTHGFASAPLVPSRISLARLRQQ